MADQTTTPSSMDRVTGNRQPVINNPFGNSRAAVSGSGLTFPYNLDQNHYWMSFAFYEYQRPAFQGNPVLSDNGAVRLPLPNQMVDALGATYSEESLSTAVGAGINQLSAGNVNGQGALNAVGAATAGGLVGAAAGVLNMAGQNTAGAVGQLAGVALNPFLTVMYKGPQFRKNTFSWILAPTNAQESATIAAIINTFKFNMTPTVSGAVGGSLLTYPNVVQVSARNATGGYFPFFFKPAVIENFQVNYSPQGQPSFFGSTDAPTAVEIRMTLHEIEFWLQDDFGTPQNGARALQAVSDTLQPLVKFFNPEEKK